MKLYLVRHGAYQVNAHQLDELSVQGQHEIQCLANMLQPLHIKVTNIFHSNKLRAKQTALLLSPSMDCAQAVQERPGLGPNDEVAIIGNELEAMGDDVLLVGHLPFMSRLVSKLVVGDENKELVMFYPGSMVCLEEENQQWMIHWVLSPDLQHSKTTST